MITNIWQIPLLVIKNLRGHPLSITSLNSKGSSSISSLFEIIQQLLTIQFGILRNSELLVTICPQILKTREKFLDTIRIRY